MTKADEAASPTGGEAASEQQAKDDAQQRQRADLHQIGCKNSAAAGAERFERGDGVDLARKIGAHGCRNTNTADGHARKADEHEERA